MATDFGQLQAFARAGQVRPLPHFRARAQERGFTVDEAVALLAQDAALAWPCRSGWLVTAPLGAEAGHQLHVQVKVSRAGALLLTGWRADPRKALRRFEAAGREVLSVAALGPDDTATEAI